MPRDGRVPRGVRWKTSWPGFARACIRFRYAVIAGWLVAAALCVTLLPSLSSAINTDNSSFLPASTPSEQAMNLADPFQPAGTTTATLVVVGKSALTTSDQNAVTSLEGKIAKDDHVVSVSAQGLSKDGEAAKAQVVINVLTSSTEASPTVAAIRATISGGGLPAGVTGYLTGQLPTAVDNQNSQASAQRLTEQLSALVILVMLAIVYRSVLAPLVTLGTAELVLQMSGHLIAEMSKAGLQVSTITQTMLVVLLLGAGTDYGLFLMLRVREEMARGAAPHAAIERAGRYIGESITFSAGHGHRRAAVPAARVVRPLLRPRPSARAGRGHHAARGADAYPSADRRVRPRRLLAAADPSGQA